MSNQLLRITTLVILYCSVQAVAAGVHDGRAREAELLETNPPNANHIFNAIHSSMRKWGSSLNHNGMGFFLAAVPQGTQLYHGTAVSQPVTGVEWLVFEPEHALGFAQAGERYGPRDKRPNQANPHRPKPEYQAPLAFTRGDSTEEPPKRGYFHMYAAAKRLRLLYIDGMAAGKTSKGTLDSQDLILLNGSLPLDGFTAERERAEMACKIATETWNDRIDGFIRMEAGYEIILCSFERDLDVVRITQAKKRDPSGGKGDEGGLLMNNWLQGIAARYHGIGGGRVSINFDHFVTAYTYNLDLFTGNNTHSRLNHLPRDQLEPIRTSMHDLVMSHSALESSFDWQSVADMIINRYSDELQFRIFGSITSTSSLHAELEPLLQPFIDYSHDDTGQIIDRCSNQFISYEAPNGTLASRVVRSISSRICSKLVSGSKLQLGAALTRTSDLVQYLSWTTWKDCRGCPYGEICVIPMWPMRTIADYEQPICQAINMPLRSGDSYWGSPGHVFPPPNRE